MWPFSSSQRASDLPTPPSASLEAGPSLNSAAQQQQQSQDPTSYLSSHSFASTSNTSGNSNTSGSFDSSGSYTSTSAPSTSDIFSNPAYQLDLTKLHPLAGLSKDDVEYLDIVDEQPSTLDGARTALPSRGWSDDLCYGTGTTYLSGLALGGMLGVREGLVRPLGVQSPTARLRLNAVLNSVTRRASFLGNSAGVIGEDP